MSADASPLKAVYPPSPSTERGHSIQVGLHKNGSTLVYCNGSNVIVRDLKDKDQVVVYTEHRARAIVAKPSPSGNWVASGDETGKVRVWALDHPEHILKVEVPVFAGEVHDIAWDPENKRVVAVGNGRDTMVKAFMWDTGNSLGDMAGHAKRVLTADYKPTRPFRVATGGEDFKVVFFAGPPFKFERSSTEHANFVNCLRYSPIGDRFATVSSDKACVLYDGKTGEPVARLDAGGGAAHEGGAYGVAWSPDGARLATVSADKTLRIWEAGSGALLATKPVAPAPGVDDMLVSVCWGTQGVVTVSLCGDVSVFSPDDDAGPTRVMQAHQGTITAMAVDAASGVVAVGANDGRVTLWREGEATRVRATPHRGVCSAVAFSEGRVVSAGWDSAVRVSSLERAEQEQETAVEGEPRAAASAGDLVAVISHKGVALLRGGASVSFSATDFTPTAVALSPDASTLAVGTGDAPYVVRLYRVAGDALEEAGTLATHRGAVQALAFSPDGSLLAAGDAAYEVRLWDMATKTARVEREWVAHCSKVTSVAWHPSGKVLASGSIDQHIMFWWPDEPRRRQTYKFAHKHGVTAVGFLRADALASAGGDACVRLWSVPE